MIPDTIGGCPVTSIGCTAFYGCTELTSITIPDAVMSIEGSAFSGCTGLTSITIPDSVTSIGCAAFYGCTGLQSITVDENNPVYDSRNNCNAIIKTNENELIFGCRNTVIPETVTTIGIYAFSHCSDLTSITIPDSVTSIAESAFSHCIELTNVTLGESVESIGSFAFSDCNALTSVTIPGSVEEIGLYAFGYVTEYRELIVLDDFTIHGYTGSEAQKYADENGFSFVSIGTVEPTSFENSDYEYKLKKGEVTIKRYKGSEKNVVVPDELNGYPVTAIGYRTESCTDPDCKDYEWGNHTHISGAFENTGVQSVTLPDTITMIDKQAFKDCTQLGTINLPEGVTTINKQAFDNCSALESIHIPASATNLFDLNEYYDIYNSHTFKHYNNTFKGCSGLQSITVDENNPVYDSRDNCNAIIETEENMLLLGCQNTAISDSITEIGDSAFNGCTGLTELVVPDNILSIMPSAFYGCSGLTELVLPNNDLSNGLSLGSCTGLERVVIPDKINCDVLQFSCLGTKFHYGYCNEPIFEKGPESNLVIYGYYGTGAELYANMFDIPFRMIAPSISDEVSVDTPEGTTYSVVKKATDDEAVPDPASPGEAAPIENQPLPEGSTLLNVYDLTLRNSEDETPVQPDSPVTVRIRCDNPTAQVFRREADGSLTDMNAEYKDGSLIIKTDRSGTFIVTASADVNIALCGDADGDGEITSIDATMIQRYLAGLPTGVPIETLMRGDVDGDGELEVIDVTLIERYPAQLEVNYPIGEAIA